MPTITELQIFYRRLDNEKVEAVHIAPTSQETAVIKMDVAREVKKIKDGKNAEYYYVVVRVRKSDGSDGYRTIVPKTLI